MNHGAAGRLAVIGGGTMGAGIAYAALRSGATVTVVEENESARSSLSRRVEADLRRDLDRGLINGHDLLDALERLRSVKSVDELEPQTELVIEAVPEDITLKSEVLRNAETHGFRWLATNTSSISITALAESLEHPERLVGLHFFNPVRQMVLVEIVVGERTDPALVDIGRALVSRLGKEALVVSDSPGFLTSRLGVALGLEAIRMLEAGVASAAEIDRAMVLGYAHPMGPLRLTDLVGLDVRLNIAHVLEAAYGSRFSPPQLLIDLVAEGRLGRKTGRGFFEWDPPGS